MKVRSRFGWSKTSAELCYASNNLFSITELNIGREKMVAREKQDMLL
jgi:hypothetical protein